MEKTFYMLHSKISTDFSQLAFSRLQAHYKKIDLIISQAYQVDGNGLVSGFIDSSLINFSKQHAIPLYALVTNSDFDKYKLHQFLLHPDAQTRAIVLLITACQQSHLKGVQIDFENVSFKDRELLSSFYQHAVNALHAAGFKVSIAVVPLTSDGPPESAFLKRKFENWGGAYDLTVIGKIADFVTIMTYDQHTEGTTPGPTATYNWVVAAINYARQFVPAEKLSLGIATYSGYWYTGTHSDSFSGRVSVNLDEVGFNEVKSIITKYHTQLKWDPISKVDYAIFEHHWLDNYLYVEDVNSFKPKLQLVGKYHLRGISVFDIGNEDERIWSAL